MKFPGSAKEVFFSYSHSDTNRSASSQQNTNVYTHFSITRVCEESDRRPSVTLPPFIYLLLYVQIYFNSLKHDILHGHFFVGKTLHLVADLDKGADVRICF